MSIEVVKNVPTDKLQAWLEAYVRSHLTPDVSRYARGRLRCWLKTEPSLTSPTRLTDGLPMSDKNWLRLQEIVGWNFDYCLVTYSGDERATGIGPHRDASYADYEAWGLNIVGQCDFRYWEGRKSFGNSVNTHEFDPKKDDPTHRVIIQPGDVVRFNSKNLHAAEPSPRRWNLNFWKQK